MAIAPRPTPPLNTPLLDAGGQVSIAWTGYFQKLGDQLVTATDLANISAQVTALEAELAAFLPLSGGTLNGPLTISMVDPEMRLNRPAAGTSAVLQSQTAGVPRWDIVLASDDLETGANAGSDFAIARFGDDGTLLGLPIFINRATGQVLINGDDPGARVTTIEARLAAAGIP